MTQIENLNKLADQIYEEGIEKANQESERILNQAHLEAAELVENAKQEAERIIQKAQKKSVSIEERTSNEIRVKSNQAISDLKEHIKNCIVKKELSDSIHAVFNKESFVTELILEATQNWSRSDQIEVIVSAGIQQRLASFVQAALKEKLPDLQIYVDGSNNSGFVIKHRVEGYFIEFTPETFEAFLMPYFSRTTNDLLFNSEV